jgi:biopolymer transport protein ExbD
LIRRPSKKIFRQEPGEAIHIIALWNLMIVLIPFLLLSAVFSKTAILNIYLPEPAAEAKTPEGMADDDRPLLILSILKEGFVLNDGERVLAAVPKLRDQDHYDFKKVSSLLMELKEQLPGHEDIILLSEPEISYETIIQTMDASREVSVEKEGKKELISLFPNVSIGEVGQVTFREVLGPSGPLDEKAPSERP